MKKSVIIAALLLVSFGALQAQRDTLGFFVNIPWYFKNHPFEDIRDTTHHGTSCTPGRYTLAWSGENSIYSNIYGIYYGFFHNWNSDIAFGFYPDTTIHVIGVAWWMIYSGAVEYPNIIDEIGAILSHEHHKYDSVFCRLYIPNGNYMQLVREKGLEEFNRPDVHLYYSPIGLPTDGSLSSVRNHYHGEHPERACFVEIYFDQEIDVSDSFYVSVKDVNKGYDDVLEDMAYGVFEYHNPVVDTFIYPPLSYRLLPDSANADDPWIYGVKRTYPLLFPIIRRDCDTCPHVQGIEVIPAGNGQAFLRWQRGTGHIDWQVSYGLAGTAPDDGTLLDFSNPISSAIAFNPDSHYVAYVRARCRFARYEWGPWSDPVSIHLGDNGIDEAALSGMVTLSPNPATDEVSIDSPLPMSLVEAYDEKGACILRQELNTQHSTLLTQH